MIKFDEEQDKSDSSLSPVAQQFFRAIAYNNIQFVATVLAKNQISLTETTGTEKLTPLLLSAKLGRVAIAKLLIDKGNVNVNARNESYSALHLAAMNGQFNFVKLLLTQKNIELDAVCEMLPKGAEFEKFVAFLGNPKKEKTFIVPKKKSKKTHYLIITNSTNLLIFFFRSFFFFT